jgi:metallo-beta-lactamase family protein
MFEIEFIGATQGVTGSKHLIRTAKSCVLLDCGLYQGKRKESFIRNKDLNVEVGELDAVVISHAHIDHSGAVPMLYKLGYRGPIYMTSATRDLCSPMLQDAAYILRSDSEYIRRMIEEGKGELDSVEPLYSEEDVMGVLGLMVGLNYRRPQKITKDIQLSLYDAGHILGSAQVVLDIEHKANSYRLCFSGDIGRSGMPLLRAPEIPEGVQTLIVESTYGNKNHEPYEEMGHQLEDIVVKTHARKGKIIIPSFALERTQEVVFSLKKLRAAAKIPAIPVYVDTPLGIKLTDIYKLHPEIFNKDVLRIFKQMDSPFEFEGLEYICTVEDSMRISMQEEPCIIISASGMCEGGRILQHLRRNIQSDKNAVVIVGFQARHTLGRRIAEMRSKVRIFGMDYRVLADIHVLNGFSAHAGRDDLINYVREVKRAGDLRDVFLVHGETEAQESLQEALMHDVARVYAPEFKEIIKIAV